MSDAMDLVVAGVAGEFGVRVVRKGDRYGLKDCLVHEKSAPMIEFYDRRYCGEKFGPRGQFVSRYYAATLANHRGGLSLVGYEPNWTVTAAGMSQVCALVHEVLMEEAR